MGRLVEGIWDCNQCGNTGIRASIRECPGCGNSQNTSTKFRLPDQISYVPEDVASRISRNPNWICKHCGGQNHDDLGNCLGCGASSDGTLNYFQNKANHKAKVTRISDNSTDYNQRKFSNSAPISSITLEDSNSSHRNIGKIAIIVAVVLMVVVGIAYLLIPKEKVVTIQQMLWERTVTVQRYQTVNESDWSVPEGGRLQYRRSEFSHYEQRLVGYETKTRQVAEQYISGYRQGASSYRDLGNGYFEEVLGSSEPVYSTHYRTETYQEPIYVQDPIYRMKCYYEIEKWLFERNTRTTQENAIEPYWGERDSDMKSDERISARDEKYSIEVMDKKEKVQTISIPYSQWSELDVEQSVKVKVTIFGTGEVLEFDEH